MNGNPYTLSFGYPPPEIIERSSQSERIIDDFCRENPSNYINLVTGIRGSGKTVFITQIAEGLHKKKDWIVVNLNSQRNLLVALAARLYDDKALHTWFVNSKLNLTAFGIGVEIKNTAPIADIEEAIRRMLQGIKKNKKKLLITIDEVTNTKEMRVFASAYQIYLREGLPVFLIMTGLFKDINRLRNAPGMTFLERAPRTVLKPLDLDAIAENYTENISLKKSDANRYAIMTRGYSFAFQVIGYFLYENKKNRDKAMREARDYLFEFAYEKIWSELSARDREVLSAMAHAKSGEVIEIRKLLNCSTDQFNPYRDRLIKAGVAVSPQNGLLQFSLPFYEEFTVKKERYVIE